MSDTNFISEQTVVEATWLNDLNDFFYTIFDGTGSKSGAVTAIGAIDNSIDTGTGVGKVSMGKNGTVAEFKSIDQGTNITVTNGVNDITLDVDSVTTSSNVGTGTGLIAKTRSVDDLPFKTIKAGPNIVITNNTDDITLEATSSISNTAALTSYVPTAPYVDTNVQDIVDSVSADVQTNISDIGTNATDIGLRATIASPTLTGNPKSVTPSANDNDTSIATTAYVQTEIVNMGKVTTQEFQSTSDVLWTRPSGCTHIIAEAIGAGGGGGGRDTDEADGTSGSGAAGGYGRVTIDVTSISSVAIVIGAGGAGGLTQSSPTSGTDGGDSTFGTHITAGGGDGSGSAGFGALGGTATAAGGFAVKGGSGFKNSGSIVSFPGGNGYFGGGADEVAVIAGVTKDGEAGGGGGAGGRIGTPIFTSVNGGDGGDGLIVVTEYYS